MRLLNIKILPKNIYADKTMAVQLFQNFISNSIKYQKESNTLVITIIGKKNCDEQSIIIQDNGIGFSQDKADSIFDMFSRVHETKGYDGYGIGLATCKKL